MFNYNKSRYKQVGNKIEKDLDAQLIDIIQANNVAKSNNHFKKLTQFHFISVGEDKRYSTNRYLGKSKRGYKFDWKRYNDLEC